MVEKTFVVSITLDANLPAGVRRPCTIEEIGKGKVTEYSVPKGYMLRILDVFIKDKADVGVDGAAIFVKNGRFDVGKTDPVSTLLISNPSRPRVALPVFYEFEKLGIDFINQTAVGADGATVTFYVKVDESPIKSARRTASALPRIPV